MPSARSVSSRGIPCAITGCSSPSTSSASVAIRAPGEKHVPLTKTAVPRPIARSAGSGASRRTSRSAKARSSVAEPRAAGSLRAIAASELDDIRREYEQSLSWRVTRPLRALGRRVRAVRGGQVAAPQRRAGGHDAWLEHYHDDVLAPIDAACAAGGPDRFALFSELDLDLWALLLTQEYSAYPNIRALLPSVPRPDAAGALERDVGRAAREPERGVLPPAPGPLRRGWASARWRTRACSTSAAAGAG